MTTHYIHANLDGKQHSVKYWADGDGEQWYDYCTSFNNLYTELCDHYDVNALNIYTIVPGGKSKRLRNDTDIKKALKSLDDDDILSVILFERETYKKRKQTRTRDDDSDDIWENDSDADTDVSDDDDYYNYDYDGTSPIQWRSDDKLLKIVKRFVPYDDTDCYHCSDGINDVRYEWSSNSQYNLCSGCYGNLSDGGKNGWEERAPFEGDAPDAPLYQANGYPQMDGVRHLQYLMTVLGYMTLDQTSEYQGSFQSGTAAAVEKFRKKHKLTGGDMTVYNKKTQRKLAEVVRKMRYDGHKYL